MTMHDLRQFAHGFLFAAILLFTGVPALADGSGRRATAEEQAFHRRMQSVFAAVLPADPPAGWEITDRTEPAELEIVAENAESGILGVDFHLEWTDIERRRQAEEAAVARMAEVSQAPPVNDAQLLEYELLVGKMDEAAEAGNMAAVQKLQQELEEKAALINQAYGGLDEKFDQIERDEAVADSYAIIHVCANQLHHSLDEEQERITVAGYPAFRTKGYHSESYGWIEGSTIVFLGGSWFSQPGATSYQFANEENARHTKLQTIVVRIEADPARTDHIVGQIDWASLQREIGR